MLLGLAEAMLEAGLAEAAEGQFKVALSLAPNHTRALAGLGRVHRLRGEHLPALRHLQAAAADSPALLVEIAGEYLALGQFEAADASYRAAAAATPEDPAPLLGLAELARRQGNADVAATQLLAAAALAPHDPRIRLDTGHGLLQLAQLDTAQAQFAAALALAPQEARLGLVAVAAARAGGPRPAAPRDTPAQPARADGAYEHPVERVIAEHMDRGYYLANNADVSGDGVDPVSHYAWWGWREGRNPTPDFDTAYYVENNPDVADKNINPFWHYLVAGRVEGRKPRRPGGYQRAVIEAAREPAALTASYSRSPPERLLTEAELHAALVQACEHTGGVVLSVSHDRYTDVTGGVQLFISGEQAAFARQGMAYVNISPFFPDLRLAAPAAADLPLNIIIDGVCIGVAATAVLRAAFARWPRRAADRRLFAVHCLLGHQPRELAQLQAALGCDQNFFWLHDYSSICDGYSLLRNDASFCGAPPPDSMACRICVYGTSRRSHVAAVQALFEAVPFHVVAPSAAALLVWQAGAGFPHVSAAVREHCQLTPRGTFVRPGLRGSIDNPVRVAFIGNPRAMKGWPIWLEVVARSRRLGVYRFMHFANDGTWEPIGGVEPVAATTSADNRDAMIAALAEHEVDLVVTPSIWPETFSYVTYEALAAGADIVCLADGGNIPDVARRLRRGVVLADGPALVEFFTSERAVQHVRSRSPASLARSELAHCGTTAALDWARHAEDPAPPLRMAGE